MYNKRFLRAALRALVEMTAVFTFLLAGQGAFAQSIPDSVYYLRPAFGQGMVYFYGQSPAQGKLNICALDNTLRFIDNNGTELAAADSKDILKVVIEGVTYLHSGGIFYQLFPAATEYGIALERTVTILRDVKTGAFGTTSQTSSIREYSTFYADGVAYNIGSDKVSPYTVSETLFLYRGTSVMAFNKRQLKRLFPERKADIDAWFKAGNALPETVPEALEILALWAQ